MEGDWCGREGLYGVSLSTAQPASFPPERSRVGKRRKNIPTINILINAQPAVMPPRKRRQCIMRRIGLRRQIFK